MRASAFLLALSALAQSPHPSFAPVDDQAGLPRVLLIGDSISMGYTIPVRKLLAGKANVHRIPENAAFTGYGLKQLEAWLGESKWDAIHFNFGLHDIKRMENGEPQVPLADYESILRKIVARLKKTGASLVFATTTPVPEGKVSPPRIPADVERYNDAARRVMKDAGIPVNDLYAFALPRLAKIQLPVRNTSCWRLGAANRMLKTHAADKRRLTPISYFVFNLRSSAFICVHRRPTLSPTCWWLALQDHARGVVVQDLAQCFLIGREPPQGFEALPSRAFFTLRIAVGTVAAIHELALMAFQELARLIFVAQKRVQSRPGRQVTEHVRIV
jgi:acyl-CoA thioesterase-1